MRRLVVTVALAVSVVASGRGTALADHDHNLITPGTTVVDIADGQTEKCATEPGGHEFHERVHKGQPGDVAFGKTDGRVAVIKTEMQSC